MFSTLDVTTLIIFFIVLTLTFVYFRKPTGTPPRLMFTIPVLGDLPQFVASKGDVIGMLRKLRKKHGQIYSFYMGRQLAIIVNGYSVIHSVAVEKGLQFCGRPQTYMAEIIAKGKGLVMASGDTWKQQRQFASKAFFKLGMKRKSFESSILKEVTGFVETIDKQEGRAFDIKPYIHASIMKVVFTSIIGKHENQDPLIQCCLQLVENEAKLLPKVSILLNCLPFLKYCPGDPLKLQTIQNNFKTFKRLIKEYVIEPILINPSKEATTFVEMYMEKIKEQEYVDDNAIFTYDQMIIVLHDIFAGASETVPTTISWAILYLINFPCIQKRLQQHIDDAFPVAKGLCLDDMARLPFIEAFIAEVLRCANIVPLGGPRAKIDDIDSHLEGYRIPKNASIMFDFDSIFMDPEIFEHPEVFNPDRFINENGAVDTPIEFIPFSVGRRNCIGMQLAKRELFLYMANLINTFTFLPGDEENMPKISGSLGATHTPNDYAVRCVRRI